jgi:preprotein translocase subunit SecA
MSSEHVASPPWHLPVPELYPQRGDLPQRWLDRAEHFLEGLGVALVPGVRRHRFARILDVVNRHAPALERMSDAGLDAEATALRRELRARNMDADAVARSFAVIRETARRTLGQRHYDVQVVGGLAMLHGIVAEMNTGEGKTLTATLAAGTAALAGIPVHVITVNDYLVERDAQMLGPLYERLGLSIGRVVHGMAPDDRRQAYACNVTYVTNKEAAFDYLRDRIAIGNVTENLRLKLEGLYNNAARRRQLIMRGLHFAIVDEADSVLVDEARTPLIISQETDPGAEASLAMTAMQLAAPLQQRRDFRILADRRQIELTEAGERRLAELGAALGGVWRSPVRREEAARQALSAVHLFRRDEHYLVVNGKVQIVDEYTGRIMADRSWNEGLHQLIEAKENCSVTARKLPLARISYQRFFRRYHRLAGMTGTASEVAGELWSVYRLPVMRIPTNRPLQRRRLPDRIFASKDDKWSAIAERAENLSAAGRPVLIGTRSVLTSERISRHLAEVKVQHVVLNAKQDQDEAAIIARAGEAGRVTVATNMAGRGVDILLVPEVAARGGLHVILSERHDAGRIDRQLAGRCGRQGEPGTFEAMLSMEDQILEFAGRGAARRLGRVPAGLRSRAGALLLGRAQRRAERAHSRARRELLRLDQKIGTMLAFSGENE